MPIRQYSQPQFNPYGDDAPIGEPTHWTAPLANGALNAELAIPGSKSLTNRELVLAALADGPSLLRAPLLSRDSELMIAALGALGASIERVPGGSPYGPDLRVSPPAELLGSTSIDCGLAGTVMRFVPPIAGLALGPTTFDGDEAARRRPMGGTIAALRALGVDVAASDPNHLPFTVHGRGEVAGGRVEIDASASSQFVSGLLMAAPRFVNGLELQHTGERLPSLPHIEMTIAALAARGVVVESPSSGLWLVEPGAIAARETLIEPDLSNAAPFLAAALVAGGTVSIRDWPISTTQVGDDVLGYLEAFGASVSREDGVVSVRGDGTIGGVDLDLTTGGELAPTLIALAALAEGPSRFRGIGHIRHHETDRLAALAAEINGLGGAAVETEDGIDITPAALHGGVWHVYADHRMATAGALIGLRVPGVLVDDIAATSKTLPQFTKLWQQMRGAA